MYNKLSDVLSTMGSGMLFAAMSPEDAKKQLVQLKSNPELAKEVLDQLNKMKPGQKLAVTAGMVIALSPTLKALMVALMTLAPAAFADEGGLSDLKLLMKNPTKIDVEQVNKIQDRSENEVAKKQLVDLKEFAKTTKPGAVLPTPQAMDLKGIKITPATQGQVGLARQAIKLLNQLGSSGADAQTIKTQAQAFAKIIQGFHS
jgi:hypothetical protein